MQHDVTFYTKRGFDYKTAEYFASGRRKATAVKPLPDKSLLVTFYNGEMRFYDMTPLICPGTAFAFLADEGAFERAYIDENHDIAWDIDPQVDSAVVWNNKVDISADTCYLAVPQPRSGEDCLSTGGSFRSFGRFAGYPAALCP